MPIFTGTMSRNRFEEILYKIRFDDKSTRITRSASDRLAAIRQVTDLFRQACHKAYIPSSNVTVDERITPFRGNCRFRVYMKNKPHKYGIKSWVLADSRNNYTKDFMIYLGKQNNRTERNQSMNVVLKLLEPWKWTPWTRKKYNNWQFLHEFWIGSSTEK